MIADNLCSVIERELGIVVMPNSNLAIRQERIIEAIRQLQAAQHGVEPTSEYVGDFPKLYSAVKARASSKK
jgi:hypothetical protein